MDNNFDKNIETKTEKKSPTFKLLAIIGVTILLIFIYFIINFCYALGFFDEIVPGFKGPTIEFHKCEYTKKTVNSFEAWFISNRCGDDTNTMNIEQLEPKAAKNLSGGIIADNLTNISVETLKNLTKIDYLSLKSKENLSDEEAVILGNNFKNKTLELNGLTKISNNSLESLSNLQTLKITGIKEFNDEQIDTLLKFKIDDTANYKPAHLYSEIYIRPVKMSQKLFDACFNSGNYVNIICNFESIEAIDLDMALKLIALDVDNLNPSINKMVYGNGLTSENLKKIIKDYLESIDNRVEKYKETGYTRTAADFQADFPLTLEDCGYINSDLAKIIVENVKSVRFVNCIVPPESKKILIMQNIYYE